MSYAPKLSSQLSAARAGELSAVLLDEKNLLVMFERQKHFDLVDL
jgi:hypothetical protein